MVKREPGSVGERVGGGGVVGKRKFAKTAIPTVVCPPQNFLHQNEDAERKEEKFARRNEKKIAKRGKPRREKTGDQQRKSPSRTNRSGLSVFTPAGARASSAQKASPLGTQTM